MLAKPLHAKLGGVSCSNECADSTRLGDGMSSYMAATTHATLRGTGCCVSTTVAATPRVTGNGWALFLPLVLQLQLRLQQLERPPEICSRLRRWSCSCGSFSRTLAALPG